MTRLFHYFLRISDANRAAFRDELLCQTCKIFHVRTKSYRLSRADRFDGVLTAMRSQTFPDKNNRRELVPAGQLASGVDEQAIKLVRPAFRGSLANRSQIAFPQFGFHFVCPLNMTRRQDQKQIGEFRSESAKNISQNLFLAAMGTAAEKNWPSRFNSCFDESSR